MEHHDGEEDDKGCDTTGVAKHTIRTQNSLPTINNSWSSVHMTSTSWCVSNIGSLSIHGSPGNSLEDDLEHLLLRGMPVALIHLFVGS